MNKNKKKNLFAPFAKWCSELMGKAGAFLLASALVFAWLISGPFFNYSDTWQLVINTSTTIITFLMVFLIQNTQNRDTKILNLKLDELIKANQKANNLSIDLNNLSDKELKALEKHYQELCHRKHNRKDKEK